MRRLSRDCTTVPVAALVAALAAAIFCGALVSAHAQLDVRKNEPQQIGNPFASASPQWAGPILVTDLALLAAGIMYYLKLMPAFLRSAIRSAFTFEASKGASLIAVSAILAVYISVAGGEIAVEEDLGDYSTLRQEVQDWPHGNIGLVGNKVLFAIDYLLFWVSLYVFGNIRLIPFLASIALALMTYLLVSEIARKRFAGMIAMVALLQSRIFLEFDTVVSYDNFWVLFFVVSLYLSTRKGWRRHLSPVAYYFSVASKPLAGIYAPINVFLICNSDLPWKSRLAAVAPYGALMMAVAALVLGNDFVATTGFDAALMAGNVQNLPYLLATDAVFIVMIIPVTVGLFVTSLKGVRAADSVMFMLFFVIGSYYLLDAVTGIPSQPYRMVPLVTFFAFAAGMLFAKTEPDARKRPRIVSAILFGLTLPLVALIVLGTLYPGNFMFIGRWLTGG